MKVLRPAQRAAVLPTPLLHRRTLARAPALAALSVVLASCAASTGASSASASGTVVVPPSPPAPPANPLAGLYQGASATTTNVTAPLSRHEVERDEHARLRIAEAAGGLTVTSLNTQPGEEPCTLRTQPQGEGLVIVPNQACQGRRYGITVTATTTGGSVTRTAAGLSVEIDMNVSGSYMNRPIVAVAQYHFDGARATQ